MAEFSQILQGSLEKCKDLVPCICLFEESYYNVAVSRNLCAFVFEWMLKRFVLFYR